MGIIGPPLNSSIDQASASRLKLVAAASLPASQPSAARAGEVHTPPGKIPASDTGLSKAEQAEISKLKARDSQLRQHEQAHLSASAGIDVSRASFTYQRGPDGVQYAVAGDVRIDTSGGRTPADTLARADMIRDVALAPADPSATDRSVAAQAQQMAQQASAELMQQGSRTAVNQAYASSETPAKAKIDTFA